VGLSQRESFEVEELLKEFGLNSYEARCYLALLRLGKAPASEVSKVSSVPPQRVYDSLSSLEDKGFVQVVNSRPKLYVPFPVREALLNRLYQLKLEFERRERFLRGLIEEVERLVSRQVEFPSPSGGEVFTIEGEKAITSTALRLISLARESVKVAGIRPLFTFGCRGNLGRYLKEGVKVLAVGVFDEPCKREISRLGGVYVEKKVDCSYLLIVDGGKLLYVYSGGRGLFTENKGVVAPFLAYFDNLINN
jgi:sugar-specific transcriptional regulator TrmB